MDISNQSPEVKFKSISSNEGMELINKALGYFAIEEYT